jgi:hypothetical protein
MHHHTAKTTSWRPSTRVVRHSPPVLLVPLVWPVLPVLTVLTVLMSLPTAARAQKPAGPCQLFTAADLAALAPAANGRLVADEAGALTPAQLPGLPSKLSIEQCISSPVRPSGAVPARIGLLTVEREASAADWKKIEKLLDDSDPKSAAGPAAPPKVHGAATCWQHSWSPKEGSKTRLHEVACSQTKGRRQLTLGFEHEDASKLPPTDKVAALLAKGMAAVP